MMLMNPYVVGGLLIAILITFGTGYQTGYKHANDHNKAEQLDVVVEAQEIAKAQAETDQQTAQNYEAARETVRAVYVKIKENAHANIENHPDYADCGLDADGLRLYNANPNHPEAAATGADRPVSGFASGPGWQIGNDFAKQPGTLADVLRLPSATQSVVGMGAAAAGQTEIVRANQ
jgi:hypothetical protein